MQHYTVLKIYEVYAHERLKCCKSNLDGWCIGSLIVSTSVPEIPRQGIHPRRYIL
jgi:hypothetical protein